ncbi:molybdenum-binding protein [Geodermatophilus sp. TF02-6]|uniref:TOBE domain-containing protein n=1 Tax=Geodermatophilus sp. TF02-6 TaxID=2250575 RepID=UPI000DEA1A29|nr:TOBE domain-containing protein [Geodermatophilus sp. TF02-6]RBY75527.1 molybdenum-binding protein [Geodermatophilus sp. TF02-6]
MRLSTRNQLTGTVTAINPGSVMATVKVDVSGQEVTAAVTREAVEDLGIGVGDPVVVLVKSTEVMLAVED